MIKARVHSAVITLHSRALQLQIIRILTVPRTVGLSLIFIHFCNKCDFIFGLLANESSFSFFQKSGHAFFLIPGGEAHAKEICFNGHGCIDVTLHTPVDGRFT